VIVISLVAVQALSAVCKAFDGDGVARLEFGYAFTNLYDNATGFVTRGHRMRLMPISEVAV
jgi:hypothetical protein